MVKHKKRTLQRVNYEIFILVLTIVSLLNLVLILVYKDPDITEVPVRMNGLFSLIFLLDFLLRLRTADVKRDYFVKQHGWLDLIGSFPLPGAQVARLPRLVKTVRLLRTSGEKRVLREVINNRANTAMLFILLFVILLLEFGSIAILQAEKSAAGANIVTAGDAFWWVFVTISTVGYGDYFPVTDSGRFVGFFVIVAGVAVFGTLSGFLAKNFLGEKEEHTESLVTLQTVLAEIQQVQQEQAQAQAVQEQTNNALREELTEIKRLLQLYSTRL